MGRIVKLSDINKFVKPYESTLVGGCFDLFHVGHLRYLRAASNLSRPLIVMVQTDKTISIRKGPTRPIVNQKQRAEIISSLEFVDFVLILDKPSHYDSYLKIIKPKFLVFYKENMRYRKRRAKDISGKFPKIGVVFLGSDEIKKTNIRTSNIARKIMNKPDFSKIKNPIRRELWELASESKARVGKISALIIQEGKIVSKSKNNSAEIHAEVIAIRQAKKNGINLSECELYILIPPCIMCSELILKSGIKKVYYVYPYGNDDGIKLLRKNDISVKRFRG